MNRSLTFSPSRSRPAPTALAVALAGLSIVAAAIHFWVVPEHLVEWPAAGLFFIALGIFQVAWAIAYLWRPSRPVIAVGILASLATVALWAVSRTIGVPFSPEPWKPEEIGVLDVTASALELLLVVCLAAVWKRGATSSR
jgi:hypothetical protein